MPRDRFYDNAVDRVKNLFGQQEDKADDLGRRCATPEQIAAAKARFERVKNRMAVNSETNMNAQLQSGDYTSWEDLMQKQYGVVVC